MGHGAGSASRPKGSGIERFGSAYVNERYAGELEEGHMADPKEELRDAVGRAMTELRPILEQSLAIRVSLPVAVEPFNTLLARAKELCPESAVVMRLKPLEQVTAMDLNNLYAALQGHIELQILREGGAAYEERVREQARVAFRAQWGMPPGPVEGGKSGP